MNLIKDVRLKKVFGEQELIKSLAQRNVDINDELLDDRYLAEPLENFLYLTYFPDLVASPSGQLNQYYAKYYWLLTVAERYKKKFGKDNGLEQEVFQILEHSDRLNTPVDWSVVEKLHNDVLEDVEVAEVEAQAA